ncbi:chalcone isomerase family protein [Rubrivivax gelatinosus]|uniref:Chalcone isomerase domain-containing protein n=1 Tax=Rubrivivax gelatinosus (strain NBRC 100245 / IL144) TaxID=983917 RepID=I0HP87_RUBGI|nr:chalcone isomerase family protein [Rubrivivax gelatinosus]MBG6081431.1 hypothetical protein [Rubrivivax gelatinosus]BAL94824.1 hypothetical protein RGE_14830 [Rubrivivax gelatinosus IL144]
MIDRRQLVLAAAAGLLLARPAVAQMTIAGQTFPATMKVGNAELVLNGVGTRSVAWLDGYAAALYLSKRANTPDQVVATPGAKRLQLRMLQTAPAKEFVKAIDKGFRRNTPAAQQPALAQRQAALDAQVMAAKQVKKGDVVNLDYLPGRGLVFSMNGKPGGADLPGEDLYAAVLRIFLGDRPVDERLKAGLLGQPKS